MDILIVTLFVSVLLVVAGLILFILRMGAGDFDHSDRLSLLPLQDDEPSDGKVPSVPPDSLNEPTTRAISSSGS